MGAPLRYPRRLTIRRRPRQIPRVRLPSLTTMLSFGVKRCYNSGVSVGVRQPVSRWKRWGWRAGLVLSGFIILLAAWRLVLDRLIAAELASIHEKNYPATLAELNRWYPRVPP